MDVEMRWVEAWNEVYELIGDRKDTPCVLPDFSCVSLDDCLGWLQQSVYDGFEVQVSKGWWKGQQAVVVSRERREPEG